MTSIAEALLALRRILEVGECPPKTADAIMSAVLPIFEALALKKEATRNRSRNYRKRLAVARHVTVTSPSRDAGNVLDFKDHVTSPSRDDKRTILTTSFFSKDREIVRKRRRTQFNPDWHPKEIPPELAGINLGEEWERFKAYVIAHGKLYADWDAAWRYWLRSPYRRSGNGSAQREELAERLRRQANECLSSEELGPGLYRASHDNLQKLRTKGNGRSDEPALWDSDHVKIPSEPERDQ